MIREIVGCCAAFALNIKSTCWRKTQFMSIDEWNRHCCNGVTGLGAAEVLRMGGDKQGRGPSCGVVNNQPR